MQPFFSNLHCVVYITNEIHITLKIRRKDSKGEQIEGQSMQTPETRNNDRKL